MADLQPKIERVDDAIAACIAVEPAVEQDTESEHNSGDRFETHAAAVL